jgi:hypothetical protein
VRGVGSSNLPVPTIFSENCNTHFRCEFSNFADQSTTVRVFCARNILFPFRFPFRRLDQGLPCMPDQAFARQPRQIGIKWRDFEWHFFMRREQADWLDVHHRQAIAPRIDFDASPERQGRDLRDVFVLKCRRGNINVANRVLSFSPKGFPRCGQIRFVSTGACSWNSFKKRPAVANLSL